MLLLIRTSSISAVGHNTTRAAVTTSSSSISAQGTPPTPTASASQHTPSAPASSSSVDPQRAPPTKVPEQDPTTPKSTGQSHSGKAQSHLSAKRRNMAQDQGRPLQEEIAPSNKRKMADAKEETKSPKRTKRSKSKQPPPARRKASESEAEASDSEEQEEEEKTSAHVGQGKKPPIIGSVNLREEDSLVIHRLQGDITAALISGWLSDFAMSAKKGLPDNLAQRQGQSLHRHPGAACGLGKGSVRLLPTHLQRMCGRWFPQCHLRYTTNVYLRDVPVSQHGG